VEEIVEEILNRSDRDPATPEFWACFIHTALEAIRFAIKEGQTTVAAWTAAQLAASRAMLVFIRDLQETVWRGYTVENLRAVLELWNQNHDNDDENFWQSTLDMNPIILSQLFAAPIIVLQGKAYLGGTGIGNAGANLSDYLVANKLTKNVALIEIKTPRTKLLGAKYRGLFNASPELTGAVLQISNYRDSLLKNYHSLRAESDQPFAVTDPRCIVIAGTLRKEIGDDRKRLHSFELFREGLRNVQIITYDELFHKVEILIELLQGRAEDVQSSEAPLGEKRDDTVPHRRKRSRRTGDQSGRRRRSGTKGNN
jgi:hypothetical protein